jgi:hypothetical protein
MVLLCGARVVTRVELDAVPCPAAEGRWRAVPHGTVLTYALDALTSAGYEVEKMQLALSRGDRRFFGTLTLQSSILSGVSLAVGVRSSTDRSLALGFCYGSRCFVCDNLCFNSANVIAKKHTTHGIDRYQEAIAGAVSELADYRRAEAERVQWMQQRVIDDHFAEAFLLRAYQDEKLLTVHSLPTALKEWRTPSFPDFAEEKNLWRLFNGVTYALGKRAKTNPQAHALATIRLSGLLAPPAEVQGLAA